MKTIKKDLDEFRINNEKVFQSFNYYKKTIGLIERANYAMGKKTIYTSTQCSTLNYNVNIHGTSSAQEI